MANKKTLIAEVGSRLRDAIDNHPEFSGRGGIAKLAKETGIKYPARITEYCNGDKAIPLDKMHALCVRLGVSIDWLLTGVGQPYKTSLDGDATDDVHVPLATKPAHVWGAVHGTAKDLDCERVVPAAMREIPALLVRYDRNDMEPAIPMGSVLAISALPPDDGDIAIAVGEGGAYMVAGRYSAAMNHLKPLSGTSPSYSIKDTDLVRRAIGITKEF